MTQQLGQDAWRAKFNESSAFRERVNERVVTVLWRQMRRGREKYGPDFVGDPLEHALEEALGLAVYLAIEIEARSLRQGA